MIPSLIRSFSSGMRASMSRWPLSYSFSVVIALFAFFPVIILFILASDSVQMFDARNLEILTNTLLLMFFTSLGSVLIGVPLALLLTYVNIPWRQVLAGFINCALSLTQLFRCFYFLCRLSVEAAKLRIYLG